MQRRLVDGPFYAAPNLAGHAVTVFVVHEKIRQITVPEIAVKAMGRSQFQQIVHTVIKKSPVLFLPVMFHQIHHMMQQLSL